VIASLLLVLRLAEMYWFVMPTFGAEFTLAWWVIALPLAMGGLWMALFIWSLDGYALVPEQHPDLVEHREERSYETA